MDNQVYRVIMDGYFLADASKTQVIRKLKRLFGVTEEKILNMLDGQPTIIKNRLPKNKAYQYLRTISSAGAACHIDKLNLNVSNSCGRCYFSFPTLGATQKSINP